MVKPRRRPGPDGSGPGARSLADLAYQEIQDRLVRLDIRPGAPINEEDLCLRLGLGRTPVREALKRLEYERLVVAYPRRGTFATEINVTDLTHISEVREVIEPAAAARAARHATPADRATFQALAGELAAALGPGGPPGELLTLDVRIHRAIYAATHNPYLEDTLIRYGNLATRIWCLFLDRLADMAAHVGEHRELLRVLAGGDAERAADIARRHVTEFDQAIRAVI
ncbi:MAG TPA: GntR family transcriptional regulator [Streptosporangiaceae bacterium]|nr:GntR family transcriptional regulator [Streptosporangiaceae bacterium]